MKKTWPVSWTWAVVSLCVDSRSVPKPAPSRRISAMMTVMTRGLRLRFRLDGDEGIGESGPWGGADDSVPPGGTAERRRFSGTATLSAFARVTTRDEAFGKRHQGTVARQCKMTCVKAGEI